MTRKKISGTTTDSLKEIAPLIIPVAVVAAIFIGGKKLMEFLGLSKDKGDKTGEALSKAKQFDQNYWKKDISSAAATNIFNTWKTEFYKRADQIYDAKGYIYDDETSAVSAIKNCVTVTDVSFLSYCFNVKYQKDLYSYLITFLESENWLLLKKYFDQQANN